MTDYRHVEYSLGFKVDAAETTIRMPGKRLWYAPWKRGPDVVIDMVAEMQRIKKDALEDIVPNIGDEVEFHIDGFPKTGKVVQIVK